MRTLLRVRIGIDYDGRSSSSERVWQDIEREDPTNDFTSRRVHSICNVSIILEVCRGRSRIIDRNRVVKFEIKYASDGIWQRLDEFYFYSDIAIIGVLRVSVCRRSALFKVKEKYEITVYIHVVSCL